MKRNILSLSIFFCLLSAWLMGAPMAYSQHEVLSGAWKVYGSFSSPATKIVVTPKIVYFLSGASLFGYDTETNENITYTTQNQLSDVEVCNIFYNSDEKFLLVCYTSGNLDFIYDDDTVVNVPDIALAQGITGSRKINDVAFVDNKMYIAADFGLVEMNIETHETVYSGIYNQPVAGVAVLGNRVVVNVNDGLYYFNVGERFNRVENLTYLTGWSNSSELMAINDRTLLIRSEIKYYIYSVLYINFNGNELWQSRHIDSDGVYETDSQPIITLSDGTILVVAGDDVYTINDNREFVFLTSLPSDLSGNIIGTHDGKEVWGMSSKGVTSYKVEGGITSPTAWTSYVGRYLPEGFTVREVAYITPSADGERIYFTSLGLTNYRMAQSATGLTSVQATSRIDSHGNIEDMAVEYVEAQASPVIRAQRNYGYVAIGTSQLAEDPDDPDTYFICTSNDGLYKVTNGQFVGRYTDANSPLAVPYGWRAFDVKIDSEGNLWLLGHGASDAESLMVLPASKRRLNPEDVEVDDWKVIEVKGYRPGNEGQILLCEKSNMVFITSSWSYLGVINTGGTPLDTRDDVTRVWTSFTDQDNKSFSPDRFSALVEDASGRVWMGSSTGIIEFTRPEEATNSDFTVRRIKVPRNDGSNLADYLAGDDMVYGISVDNANRKWIATESSGVYLASADGDEILATYNTDNSSLPDNMVNDVYADPLGNAVWMATSQGIVVYGTDTSPAMPTYDDILVYPNPVRPEYTGLVTIKGLMDNSLIKIADASGRVVYQTRSDGGMAQWDDCNFAGVRVKTGVYFVFVSENSSGSTTAAVAKIMVVN